MKTEEKLNRMNGIDLNVLKETISAIKGLYEYPREIQSEDCSGKRGNSEEPGRLFACI